MILTFLRNLYRDLVRQPMRTILTLSGVVWGTFAVVLLLAFGGSVQKSSMKSMRGMGQRMVIIWPGRTTKEYRGLAKGRAIRITPAEVLRLSDQVPGIRYASPEFRRSCRLRYKKEESSIIVRGVGPEYEIMRNTIPASGRFFNDLDLKYKRRVCFIGNRLASHLAEDEDVIGKNILVEGVPFKVIGVMIEKIQNSNYGGNRDRDTLFMPWTTFSALYGNNYVGNFIFDLKDNFKSGPVKRRMREYLGPRLGFDPTDNDALFMWDVSEMLEEVNVFFLAFNIFLGIIGSFTLLVGGVGVASIMMVVVEERTREIGIKLAVGAKRRQILFQFFFESLGIIVIGGIIGFLLAAVVVGVLPAEKIKDYVGVPEISPLVGLITVLILLVIGGISGIVPARRAASTNPIEALRS